METWQLQEAKAKLSELISHAKNEPQMITQRGEEVVVVLSVTKYIKLIGKKQHLVDFLRSSPLCGLDVKISRDKTLGRKVKF